MSATTIALALQLALELLAKSQTISALIGKAQAEGRTQLSADEWDSIIGADEEARQRLVDAIAAAKQKEQP